MFAVSSPNLESESLLWSFPDLPEENYPAIRENLTYFREICSVRGKLSSSPGTLYSVCGKW